jgi:23S rRNA pseudouridine1911/1915/1917 synthase
VHRLDKDTTGLMVAAKSNRAHKSLTGQLPTTAAAAMRRGYVSIRRRAEPPARHGGPSIDRHPRPENGGARKRPRGDYPLGGQEAFNGATANRPGAFNLPARDRPHPSDPVASRHIGRTVGDAVYGPHFKTKPATSAPQQRP